MNTIAVSPKSTALSALKSTLLIVGGSLFVALLSKLSIPLPFTPVPVTGQSLAVVLVGASLGSRRGPIAVALYLLEGASGLPFFAATGTWAATGGYLLAFAPAAYVAGILAERGMTRTFARAFASMLLAQTVILLGGMLWISQAVGVEKAFWLGVAPFILGELVKSVVAASSLPFARKLT